MSSLSRGLSTRDIEAHLEEIYGVKVGRDRISKVTDAVMEDPGPDRPGGTEASALGKPTPASSD